MLGLHFYNCKAFGLSFLFESCILNHSSFHKTKCKKTIFNTCSLHEVDFSDCDISESQFRDCDLQNASFENTNIEKADFSTSYNFSINPETNHIKKAHFSIHGLPGLLEKYDIDITDI
jgi:uncharacterized protein YjbI with pentapeptide repeats